MTYDPVDIFSFSNPNATYKACVSLQEDYYDTIQFAAVRGPEANYSQYLCVPQNGSEVFEIGDYGATVNYSTSYYLQIENPKLHQWENCTGDVGLAYNYDNSDTITQFQEILIDVTDDTDGNLIFGLDYNQEPEASTIQLGGVLEDYKTAINWAEQGDNAPQYHELIIEDLEFCGVPLLKQFSNNWNVIVDSGSSCITLPDEIYDKFYAYMSNTTVVEDAFSLPAFQFHVSNVQGGGSGDTLFIPLFNLLLPVDAIDEELGAPYVTKATASGGLEQQRLCVIKGPKILLTAAASDKPYTSPPPTIIFGSLTLQSMYFAANFLNQSVGLANKLSSDAVASFTSSTSGCKAEPICEGDQHYSSHDNKCHEPNCASYFLSVLDEDSHTCKFKQSSIITGLFFVLLFATGEIVSYFVVQYSASSLLDPRRNQNHADIGVGPVTKEIGRGMCKFVDFVLIYALGWVPVPQQQAGGGGHQRQQLAVPLQNPV